MPISDHSKRWLAFATLCLADLMIVLDSTVVNVALPSIREHLAFSEANLVWVVNAYILTYGGFMLLGGRLGDLYGERRLLLIGVAGFTLASLVCGVAVSQPMLIIARAIQGVGGAVVTAVAVALIMRLFPEGPERVKAMGYFGFIGAGGGSVGLILGGLLTDLLNWRWIFLINLPVGIAVTALSMWVLAPSSVAASKVKLDVAGAVTVTASILMAVYAIVGGNDAGWGSLQTLGLLVGAAVLMAAFLIIESKVEAPLVPLGLFKLKNVTYANIVAVLWAAGMFAWFFLSALYMQLVLGYDPLHVGLGFLPGNLIMAAFSLKLSAWVVNRFGIRGPAAIGLALAALGLLLFSFTPEQGSYWIWVFPGMTLLGIGGGMAFNPLMLAAMNDVPPEDSGLASGVLNTGFMMGGAVGLAGLAAVAAGRSGMLAEAGASAKAALNGGYHAAFLVSAVCVGLGALLFWMFVRAKAPAGDALPAH